MLFMSLLKPKETLCWGLFLGGGGCFGLVFFSFFLLFCEGVVILNMLLTYMELQGLPIFGGGPLSRPGARSPRSGPESSIIGSTGLTITGPELSGMIGLVSIGG